MVEIREWLLIILLLMKSPIERLIRIGSLWRIGN